MTTNVFQGWSPESSLPVVIFAASAADAADTFALWSSIHMPDWSNTPAKIQEMSSEWLAERPQLAAAVARARATSMYDAVLLFRDHKAGWFAVGVEATAIGTIAPVEPAVRSFQVRRSVEGLEGREVMVFAHDVTHAIQLYTEYRETYGSPVDTPFEVLEFLRWTLTGEQTILRELMDLGVIGIAGWAPNHGWSIYPPSHRLAGA